jgi:uncharacterized protein (TIGR02246 family)
MTFTRFRFHHVVVCVVTAVLSLTAPHALVAQENGEMRCSVVDWPNAATEANPAVQGIYAVLAAWRDALRDGNMEAVTTLVTEDAEFWSQGAAPVTGRTALADAFRPFFTSYELLQEFECAELVVRGDWAFMRGLEWNRLVPRVGGDTLEIQQRAFSIMRRGTDGRWRFARGMTNEAPAR